MLPLSCAVDCLALHGHPHKRWCPVDRGACEVRFEVRVGGEDAVVGGVGGGNRAAAGAHGWVWGGVGGGWWGVGEEEEEEEVEMKEVWHFGGGSWGWGGWRPRLGLVLRGNRNGSRG